MNYAVIARASIGSFRLLNTLYPCSCISLLERHRPRRFESLEIRFQQRNFSLQASAESFIKTQAGVFRTISESAPVECLQKFLLNFHEATGLPWWVTIICTTALLRSAVTVPLSIYQSYILAKVQNLHQEFQGIVKELRIETAIAIKHFKWDEKTAKYHFKRSLKKQWDLLIVRDNCHPVKASLLIWFQIPLWVSFSVALRNLVYMLPHMDANAQVTYAELTCGGFGWITNLTEPDPYFILPVALGLVNLAIIEIQSLSKQQEPSKMQRYVLYFFRGFSIFMVPIAACVPSCLSLYWTSSSMYGLVQNLVLMSPKVKRFCRVPSTPSEVVQPYMQILKGLKQKVLKVSNKIT